MGERGGHEHQSPQHRGLIRPFDISSLIEVLREEVADGGDLLCGHAADALEVLAASAEAHAYNDLASKYEALQRENEALTHFRSREADQQERFKWSANKRAEQAERRVEELEKLLAYYKAGEDLRAAEQVPLSSDKDA